MVCLSKPRVLRGAAAVLFALALAGCAASGASKEEKRLLAEAASTSLEDLIAHLEANAVPVEDVYRITGRLRNETAADAVFQLELRNHEGGLLVYRFDTVDAARADANRLDVGEVPVRVRRGPPNFAGQRAPSLVTTAAPVFHKGRFVAAYRGTEPAVISVLTQAFGRRLR